MSDAVIKDADFAEYLKDKITTKPNYGYDTQVSNLSLMEGMANYSKGMADKVAAKKKSTGYRR